LIEWKRLPLERRQRFFKKDGAPINWGTFFGVKNHINQYENI